MSRLSTSRTFGALALLPGLAACSFLLDFDALQEGTGGAAGLGTAAGSGGTGGSGGSAGSETGGSSNSGEGGMSTSGTGGSGGSSGTTECPEDCFHDDPCLRSGCDENGACLEGNVVGLALDGVDETIAADAHFRVTMVGADDAFYLSSFAVTNDKPEVTFYRLDGVQDELSELGTLGGLNIGSVGDPVSAAGLTVQPITGIVHAFVAMNDRLGMGSRVWHVLLNATDAPKPMPVGSLMDGYWTTSPFNYPAAIQVGNQIYVAWINENQTIGLSDGSMNPPRILAADKAATTVSLLTSSDDQPYALYTVAGGGVFVERPDIAPLPISECQPAPGDYLSSSTTFSNLPGFWIGSWTKFGAATDAEEGYLTSTGRAILCGPDGCLSDDSDCAAGSPNNLVRNPATILVHRPGDPAGRMELIQALPALEPQDDGTVTAWLVLTQSSLNYNPQNPLQGAPTVEEIAEAIPLSGEPTTEAQGFRGADFPALAFVPPDRFAVAWTQPSKARGEELRVQRYKMCLPD